MSMNVREMVAVYRDCRTAADPLTPMETLRLLVRSPHENVRASVLNNPAAMSEQLVRLVWQARETYLTRLALAGCVCAPTELLEEVFREGGWAEHMALVNNPKTPLALLTMMSNFKSKQAPTHQGYGLKDSVDIISKQAKRARKKRERY